jgi:hypothetical protein
MNQIWMRIFLIMIGGSIVKYLFASALVWVGIDLAVLAVCYLTLKRYPFVDLKTSMLFLGGLTVVSVLTDLGIISGLIANVIILALLAWMMFGRNGNNGPKRPQNRHKWHK